MNTGQLFRSSLLFGKILNHIARDEIQHGVYLHRNLAFLLFRGEHFQRLWILKYVWRSKSEKLYLWYIGGDFPTLVNMFYGNLRYAKWGLTSEVNKYNISLSLEAFGEIFNFPWSGPYYMEINQGGHFISCGSLSFLQDPNSNIPSPFLMVVYM